LGVKICELTSRDEDKTSAASLVIHLLLAPPS